MRFPRGPQVTKVSRGHTEDISMAFLSAEATPLLAVVQGSADVC